MLAFVAEGASGKELQAKYGLGLPELSATVTFTDPKKPAKTLSIGKVRSGAPGYFARLEGAHVLRAQGVARDDE